MTDPLLGALSTAGYAVAFVGGLSGAPHCVGMCGAFPLAVAGAHGTRSNLPRQVLYNFGRLNTLVFVGALSGGLGAALVATPYARLLGAALSVFGGLFMIVVGLEMLGLLRRWSGDAARVVYGFLSGALRGLVRAPSRLAPLALGVLNAFLPCHLIYAFAASAAASASLSEGALTMFFFGLGTVPAMLAVGLAPQLARRWLGPRLSTATAVLIILFGCLTVWRGLEPFFGHGCHPLG